MKVEKEIKAIQGELQVAQAMTRHMMRELEMAEQVGQLRAVLRELVDVAEEHGLSYATKRARELL